MTTTPSTSPGPWLREGTLVYQLRPCGAKAGVEQFENRFTCAVQVARGVNREEADGIAALVQAAPQMAALLREILASGLGLDMAHTWPEMFERASVLASLGDKR